MQASMGSINKEVQHTGATLRTNILLLCLKTKKNDELANRINMSTSCSCYGGNSSCSKQTASSETDFRISITWVTVFDLFSCVLMFIPAQKQNVIFVPLPHLHFSLFVLLAVANESQPGTCAFLSRSMVRASQSGQQVSSSRVMRAKASMDPRSCNNT